MGLLVKRVRLTNFRNYQQAEFEFGEGLTVIGGPNAAGKTSVVEALQLTTAAQSFRNPPWKETIRWGETEAAVSMEATGDGRSLVVNMRTCAAGRRYYSVNGKKMRKVADVRGLLPCVTFTPDDLLLVKGSAERRRNLLDSLGDQLSHTYEALRKEYERALKQRNAAIKEGNSEVIEALEEPLVVAGARYTIHRRRLLARLVPYASMFYKEIAGIEALHVSYEQGWGSEENNTLDQQGLEGALHQTLRANAEEERRRGVTLAGPHKDDILFEVGGQRARAYASQGQQRSVALAWKLAEVAVVHDVTKNHPLLLLDDVMSELDEARREALTRLVGEDTQTVVTTTNLHYFSRETIEQAHVLELER